MLLLSTLNTLERIRMMSDEIIDIPEEMEGIRAGEKHFHRVNPEMPDIYQTMLRSMSRDLTQEGLIKVSLTVSSNKNIILSEVKEHKANMKPFVDDCMDRLAADNLKMILGHIDQPISSAITLIRSLTEEEGKEYSENVIVGLEELLTYNRPWVKEVIDG